MRYGVELPGHIGPYSVERELGSGGMGTVYLARSRGGRTVAVKVARPELAADPHFRARFRAEVEAARKVGGFHTAQVVDADTDADTPWLATAYVAGPTLAGLIGEQGPMDESRLRSLGAALAEALGAIHACGLIHRDLKPGNIIMADDGPRVLDFGIARAVESTRLTSTGAAFGTPGFLAPEQAQGLEVSSAADVFALGAVLVAAAGGSAFGGGTPMGLMYRSVHEPADLSAVPEGIRHAVADCLTKDPALRPSTERLLDLFAPQASAHPPTPTHPPTLAVAARPTAGGGADPATAGAFHQLATRPAAAPDPRPSGRPRTARNWRIGIAAAVLVVGGVVASYLAKGIGDGDNGDGEPFPAAKYEIVRPPQLMAGEYKMVGPDFLPAPSKLDGNEVRKDAFEIKDDYTGGKEASFNRLTISAEYGRFKDPDQQLQTKLDYLLDNGSATTAEPLEKIKVPGSTTEFGCRTARSATYVDLSVCTWADENTIVVLEFEGSDAVQRAAEASAEIYKEIRRPIAESGS